MPVSWQHPDRRPAALPAWQFGADFKAAIQPVALAFTAQPGRGIRLGFSLMRAMRRIIFVQCSAGVSFLTGNNMQDAVFNVGIFTPVSVALQFIVTATLTVLLKPPFG